MGFFLERGSEGAEKDKGEGRDGHPFNPSSAYLCYISSKLIGPAKGKSLIFQIASLNAKKKY